MIELGGVWNGLSEPGTTLGTCGTCASRVPPVRPAQVIRVTRARTGMMESRPAGTVMLSEIVVPSDLRRGAGGIGLRCCAVGTGARGCGCKLGPQRSVVVVCTQQL
jgi:hypothetical protein